MERITKLPSLPHRPVDGHKGTFGKVLAIGGSRGMSGSIALTGISALRGGAGLVSLVIPTCIAQIVATLEPSYLTIPLAEDNAGRLSRLGRPFIEKALTDKHAIAVGPGLGQSPALQELVVSLYETLTIPLLIDADALNLLAQLETLPSAKAPRILTPHPGEFARLSGHSIDDIAANREELATNYAAAYKVTLVLKGKGTVITDGERVAINETGNSGMATGGSGDVLTGVILALLGQGMSAFDAAQLGVYLHGLAGDLAAEEHSEPGMIASDLPKYLGAAWKRMMS